MEEARAALRALVEKIVLVPVPAEDTEDGKRDADPLLPLVI